MNIDTYQCHQQKEEQKQHVSVHFWHEHL